MRSIGNVKLPALLDERGDTPIWKIVGGYVVKRNEAHQMETTGRKQQGLHL
jgi:hypothetical protein